MALPSHRLALLKAEYETTPISIEELCIYHQVQPSDLRGYTKWEKKLHLIEPINSFDLFLEPEPLQILTEPTQISTVLADSATTIVIPTKSDISSVPKEEDIDELKTDIKECKVLAIKRCKDFLTNDAKFAEIKEIKDIVSIVTDIDKSVVESKVPQGNTYTVLINNLIANFRDDC